MARITYSIPRHGGYVCTNVDTGETLLIGLDWDYPSFAENFGFSMRSVQRTGRHCNHNQTDGTVPCPDCGLQPGDFIQAASAFLDQHEEEEAEDPGYFSDR